MAGTKLTVGAVGDEVARLHDDLTRSGFAVPAEEIQRKFFGPATRAAVADCQRCNHMEVTGQVDEATAAVLSAAPMTASQVAAAAPTARVPAGALSVECAAPQAPGADAADTEAGRDLVEGHAYSGYVVPACAALTPLEALHQSPLVLRGVTPDASAALQTLNIRTVFDLATSRVFLNAMILVEHGFVPDSLSANFALTPDGVAGHIPGGFQPERVSSAGLSVIEGIGPAKAPIVYAGLGVHSVRDLSLWPPYAAARAILDAACSPELDDATQSSTPSYPISVAREFDPDR